MRFWRKILPILWVVVFIHFLKDITQDILQITTFLDWFGNIQEDLSGLPFLVRDFIIASGYLSFFGEIFLLVAIPIVKKRNSFSKLEAWIIGVLIFMLIYFPIVLFLDPRF
jgi:hypothetical protein